MLNIYICYVLNTICCVLFTYCNIIVIPAIVTILLTVLLLKYYNVIRFCWLAMATGWLLVGYGYGYWLATGWLWLWLLVGFYANNPKTTQ